jgi:hypothetical protein
VAVLLAHRFSAELWAPSVGRELHCGACGSMPGRGGWSHGAVGASEWAALIKGTYCGARARKSVTNRQWLIGVWRWFNRSTGARVLRGAPNPGPRNRGWTTLSWMMIHDLSRRCLSGPTDLCAHDTFVGHDVPSASGEISGSPSLGSVVPSRALR